MLLRSASSPILNQWKSHSKETETINPFSKSTLPLSCSSSFPTNKMTRALSESDLSNFPIAKKKPFYGFYEIEEEEAVATQKVTFFCNELCFGEDGNCGGGGGDDDGCSRSWDWNHENDETDLYYRKMIEANPENSLLLANYARFLKEIRGDLLKAEEYFGRAILENPSDGDALSMYADLIWQNHKDASRAESYFDQAAKASPDNCYVLASYARFLWDAEDDDEEDGVDSFDKQSSPNFVFGVQPQPLPLAAAS